MVLALAGDSTITTFIRRQSFDGETRRSSGGRPGSGIWRRKARVSNRRRTGSAQEVGKEGSAAEGTAEIAPQRAPVRKTAPFFRARTQEAAVAERFPSEKPVWFITGCST